MTPALEIRLKGPAILGPTVGPITGYGYTEFRRNIGSYAEKKIFGYKHSLSTYKYRKSTSQIRYKYER